MNGRPVLSPFVEDYLFARGEDLLADPVGRALDRAVGLGVVDRFVVGEVRSRAARERTARAFQGAFVEPRLQHGALLHGHSLAGAPIRSPLGFLNSHVLTVGGSGSGKTTRARNLILQVSSLLPVWAFDFRKREFARLCGTLRGAGVDMYVVQGRNLRLNPLQVPVGVAPESWAAQAADLLVAVLALPPRAASTIHTAIFKLYRSMRVDDHLAEAPTLHELAACIRADRGANPQAKDAILGRLEPVLLSIGAALDWHRGWTTEALARHRVVFEFGGLAEADKDLLVNSLLLSEFASRIARGYSNRQLDLLVVCDEAARLCCGEGRSALDDAISLVRGCGIGLDLSTQDGRVSRSILGNTATKFIGRCGSTADYDAIGGAIGLTVEQRKWMALSLVPGTFVGQFGEGAWRRPFTMRVDPSFDPDGPSDVPDHDAVLADELMGVRTTPGSTSVRATVGSPPREMLPAPRPDGLSDIERRYIRAVIDHPAEPSSVITKLAGLGPKRAQEIRQRLVDSGHLRVHAVQTGRTGRSAIVLEALEKARTAVDSNEGAR